VSSWWFPIAFAVAVVVGAMVAIDAASTLVAFAVMSVALILRRRIPLVIAGFVLAAALSVDARAGLVPVGSVPIDEVVVAMGDPRDLGSAVVVDLRTSSGRMELIARGALAARLTDVTVGSRLHVRGRIEDHPHPDRVIVRHIRGRITPSSIDVVGRASWSEPIERVRGVIAAGADALPQWQRPIYLGFVIGDDRGSSSSMVEAFERAGLSHLLVVSGQNVAFVLIVASPVLSRLARRRRLLVTIAILIVFAAVARFEPSVLRAVAMAAVVAIGVAGGHRAPAPVVLANAVAIVVLADPLLVMSLGFRLSVAATLGIVTLARPIAMGLRGPRWIATGVAVCTAAQVAVAPLLIPTFGPLRLISIPANVLAEPTAALVMMWGCTGGVIAGLIGGPIGAALQLPSRAAIWWIGTVATTASDLPSPEVDLRDLAVITMVVAGVRAVRHRRDSTRDRIIAV